MYYWEGKIAGLLHDPLDKVLRKKHAEDAAQLASKLLEGSQVNAEWIQEEIKNHHKAGSLPVPDKAASAANRTLTPKTTSENVLLQNPFSGILIKLELPKPFSQEEEMDSKPLAEGKNGKESMLRIIKNLIEVYQSAYCRATESLENSDGFSVVMRSNMSKALLLLPEDTRVPSSPILSHVQMVSALVDVDSIAELGFYMVYIDIGGVQEFITVSRKTVDFWASSYLSSLISLSAIKALIDRFGPQQLIFPWYLYSPLTSVCIFGGDEEYENELYAPTVPNSALALVCGVPDESEIDEQEIKIMVYTSMRKFWDKVCKLLIGKLRAYEIEKEVEEQIKSQMSFFSLFSKVRVAVMRFRDDVRDDNGQRKGRFSEIYKRAREEGNFEQLAEFKKRLSDKGKGYESYILEDFEAIEKTLSVIMNSQRQLEVFYANEIPRGRKRCSLCGIREILDIEEDSWKKMEEELIVNPNERLCAVCLLKRFFKTILPDLISWFGVRGVKPKLKDVPSVSDIATTWFRASMLSLAIAAVRLNYVDDFYTVVEKYLDYFDKAEKLNKENGLSVKTECWYHNKLLDNLHKEILDLLSQRTEELVKSDVNDSKDNFQRKIQNISKFGDLIRSANSTFLLLDAFTSTISRIVGDETQRKVLLKEVEEAYNETFNTLNRFKEKEGEIFSKLVNNASKILFTHVCSILDLSDMLESGVSLTGTITERILEPLQRMCEIVRMIKRCEKLPLPVSISPQNRFVLMRADGDDVSKWISGELSPPWQILISPDNEEKVLQDRILIAEEFGKDFGELYSRNRPVAPSTISVLSMIIALNSRVIKSVVEAFGGFLIYTGGDDVLALLPPEVWHYAYLLLHFLYSREIMDSLRVGNERLYVYGMGVRASSSFSVVVAHHKAHLKQVIKNSYELLEDLSKELKCERAEDPGRELKVKNGLSVILMARSAPIEIVRGIPNMLIRSDGDYVCLREFDVDLKRKVEEMIKKPAGGVVREWLKNLGPLLSVIYEDASGVRVENYYETYDKVMEKLHFMGITPDSGGLIEAAGARFLEAEGSDKGVREVRVYVPISDAVTLCDLFKSGIISSRAFYDMYNFCGTKKRGPEELECELTLLYSSLKHKIEEKNGIPVAKVLRDAIERMMTEKYLVGKEREENEQGRMTTLLEVFPLALILSRCLDNAILSDGGW